MLTNDDLAVPYGMRGYEFGLSDEAARRFHGGLKGEIALGPDEIRGLALQGRLQMVHASAIGIICVGQDTLEQQLQAGQAYIDLVHYLALSGQGIGATKGNWQTVKGGFKTSVHAALAEVETSNTALKLLLRTKKRPTLIFRIGIPIRPEDAQRPHSARPSLDQILLPQAVD